MAGYRIPDELEQAYPEAIHQLEGWKWVGREPEEDCRSYRSIGSIADYASIFDDPMPDEPDSAAIRLHDLGKDVLDRLRRDPKRLKAGARRLYDVIHRQQLD